MAHDSSEGPTPSLERGITTLEQRLDSASGVPVGGAGGCYLLMVQGPTPGRLCRIGSETTIIGRGSGVGVYLDDTSVSTQHAKIVTNGAECWIVDLGSTNGTYVNQNRVVGTVALQIGDALKIGATVFAFLAEGEDASAHTVSLSADHSGTQARTSGLFGPAAGVQVGPALPARVAEDGEEGVVSLLDWIKRVRFAWGLVKRYAWLLITLGCLGLAGGVIFARMNPPAGTAWFEISLQSEASANPMANTQKQPVIFMAPQNAFRSLPQIRRTMKELEYDDFSDAACARVKNDLGFDPLDRWGKIWRGEYRAKTAEVAQSFLETHLDLYLKAEIDKTLQLIQTRDQFLGKQLSEAAEALTSLEGRMAEYRENYPELLPLISDVEVAPTLEKASTTKAGVSGRLGSIRGEIASLRARMAKGDSLLVDRLKGNEKYRTQIAKVEAEIVQAKADGLTDQHPKVTKLRSQLANLERLSKQSLLAKTTEVEKLTNADYRKMKARVDELQREQSVLQGRLRAMPSDKPVEKPERLSLRELEANYREMARNQTNAAALYQTLSTNKKANELQLEIERAAASSRYDIITPPTGQAPNMRTSLLKRLAMGGAAGILLALFLAGIIELRYLIRNAEMQLDG